MRLLIKNAAVVGLLATSALALAQPPGGGRGGRGGPPPEPSLISYEQAQTAMAAAVAHARENGWAMTIRIVDQNDNIVMVSRIDNAAPFTATVAERKTRTVIGSGMTSAEYAVKVEAGDVDPIENDARFGGGVPVYMNGELAGAIAASGAAPDQDEAVSKAGVEAIGGSTMMPD